MNPRQFALFLGFYFYVPNVNAANDAQRVILLSSLKRIRALKAQLLLWNQRRRRRRGRRFGFCQDHSSRGLTHIILIILILQFQETISSKHKYALGAIEYSSPAPDKSKCEAEKS